MPNTITGLLIRLFLHPQKGWKALSHFHNVALTRSEEETDYQSRLLFPMIGWLALVAFLAPMIYGLLHGAVFKTLLIHKLYNTVFYVGLVLILFYPLAWLGPKLWKKYWQVEIDQSRWELYLIGSCLPLFLLGLLWNVIRPWTEIVFFLAPACIWTAILIQTGSASLLGLSNEKARLLSSLLLYLLIAVLLGVGVYLFSIFVIEI